LVGERHHDLGTRRDRTLVQRVGVIDRGGDGTRPEVKRAAFTRSGANADRAHYRRVAHRSCAAANLSTWRKQHVSCLPAIFMATAPTRSRRFDWTTAPPATNSTYAKPTSMS
jgi:hypothetical protein